MEESVDDMILNTVVLEGARRCINSRRQGTSAIFPEERGDSWSNQILEAQRDRLTPNQLAVYQLELLKRADALLQFFDSNVGGSDEFPLQLIAESFETLDAFHDFLSSLRSAVGVLTEV